MTGGLKSINVRLFVETILKQTAQETTDAAEWVGSKVGLSRAGLLTILMSCHTPRGACGVPRCPVSHVERLFAFHRIYVQPTLG